MSPLRIKILMHYYCNPPEDYPSDGVNRSPEQPLVDLEKAGYLVATPHGEAHYAATEKLRAYCQALCEVPEPVETTTWKVVQT